MSLNINQKTEVVNQVSDRFGKAVASVFVDFRGLDVQNDTMLRTQFRSAGVEYQVVKNNLIRRALEKSESSATEQLDEFLKGPTAVAWSYEDPSAAAKIIKEFLKKEETKNKLVVKCGLLDNKVLTAKQVEMELASLPGKDELRAKLLAQLQAPMNNLVRQLFAPGQSLAYALNARKEQQG